MAEPIHVKNSKIVNEADMSTSITSTVEDLSNITNYSVHAVWTGTPTGTLDLQASNDGVNFISLLGSLINTGGAAGQHMFEVTSTSMDKVRLVYTFSSGSGTLTATYSAKRRS